MQAFNSPPSAPSSSLSRSIAICSTDCPLCFERYRDDESGQRVPRNLQCGHSACQGCYAKMLAPVQPQGNVKPLPCPMCRVVTEVARGQAASLQKIFALLR